MQGIRKQNVNRITRTALKKVAVLETQLLKIHSIDLFHYSITICAERKTLRLEVDTDRTDILCADNNFSNFINWKIIVFTKLTHHGQKQKRQISHSQFFFAITSSVSIED